MACATVLPSDTVIAMTLPDSASIFTAEVWVIIKALEQIKDSVASMYIIFTDSLPCLQTLQYIKLEHPLIRMVIQKCVFLNFANKDITFCWVPSHVALGAIKRQLLLPSLLWICLVSRLVYPTLIWNTILPNLFFPFGKMISKLHSIKPVLGDWQSSYRQCRKAEVVSYTHLTHSHIYILRKDPPPQCEHCPCILN